MFRRLRKWLAYAVARMRARRHARAVLAARPARRVLVICYGNIYRSPFVAAQLQAGADMTMEIRSAGFHDREGRAVEPGFIDIARGFGIDLSAHRSRRIHSDDLNWADIVLIMDGHNYRLMQHHHPESLGKTFWLGAVTRLTPILIKDPYKSSPDRQRDIALQLDTACKALLAALNSRATAS